MNTSSSSENHFERLGLPVACDVDEQLLEANYKQLQTRFHPDRFAGEDAASRLQALQQASILNDAYTTLKSPLSRAEHLLAIQGIDAQRHEQADMDGSFLLVQMGLREELEDAVAASDPDALYALGERAETEIETVWQTFKQAYVAGDYQAAKPLFHKLQFLHKLSSAIGDAEERLLDY